MFIAHLPASYLLTTGILTRVTSATRQTYRLYLRIGLIAGVLPDIDLIYFYLIDQRQHLHHTYWTHLPVYWFAASFLLVSMGELFRSPRWVIGTLIGFSNLMAHLALDTVASRIRWLYPITNADLVLFPVPSRFGWWVLNYLCHWTFALEVTVAAAAAVMLYYRSGRPAKDLPRRKPTESPLVPRPGAGGGRSEVSTKQGSA